ncbi:carbon-nitrogen hydrolase [Syncephalis fuscata]|nr:carbon-nitrogen hydrolase [Syncephalis fuscata]
MRIVSCQFNPLFKEDERNRNYATQLLSNLKPGDVDILLLPEMAFTGYMFKDREEIEPWTEDAMTGPTVIWAQSQARRLQCFVLVGYPERVSVPSGPPIFYNSACIVDRSGQLISTYRKAYLYTTDLSWSSWSDTGFSTVYLDGIGEVGIGICMDVNYDLRLNNYMDCPFAQYFKKKQVKLVLALMNWLASDSVIDDTSTDNRTDSDTAPDRDTPDITNINYWCSRLYPLIKSTKDTLNNTARSIYFISSNRTGTERGNDIAILDLYY